MALTAEALIETQRAFDTVADVYDEDNERNPVLREMRRQTRNAVRALAPEGSTLLDLGCGPGADAEFFGRRGYRVAAIDWSPEMAQEAQRRARASGLEDRVTVRHLGIHELDRLGDATFACAYSSLGPLNCVPDLAAAARLIGERLCPRGCLVASVIGRICPWEIALYGLRRDFDRIRVRFSPDFVPVPFYGRTVWTRYYDPTELETAFAASGFTRVSLRSLGLLMPPPYLSGFAERHPRWLALLGRVEDWIGSWPLFRRWGDHFLIVMRKA